MPTEKDPTKLKAEELEKRVAPTLMYSDDPTASDTPEAKGKTKDPGTSPGTGRGAGPVDQQQP